MGTLWKIALRNTLRHKRRTMITAAVMMVGVGAFVVFDSMLAGMDRMAIDNMEAYTVSSIKARNPAYVDDIAAAPLDKSLGDPKATLAAFAAAGFPATPRVRFVARLSNYEDEIPVMADGVDPVLDRGVFRTGDSVVAGKWLSDSTPKTVVLGSALAKELRLKVGDSVVVSAQTLGDATNADEYLVAGIVSTPAPEINMVGLFMGLADVSALLDAPGIVTEVDGALPRAASLGAALASGDAAASKLRKALPGTRIDPISSLASDYLGIRAAKAKNAYVIMLVVLLIAAVGIVNTILMSVYSRVREIGVLRAYGMTPKDITRLFTLEGLIIGLIGSGLGVAFGALLDLWIIAGGINLDAILGNNSNMMGNIPIAGVMRGEWNPGAMVVGFVFSLLAALLAARVPARKAARLEPTEALRFV